MSDAAELLRPTGFGRPIRAAGAVVYRQTATGRTDVLLIRKRAGLWTLPKGRIKRGETAEDAVLREVADRSNATNIRARTKELRERRAD